MSDHTPGLIDTNVLIHALSRDDESEDCRAFLKKVQAGEQTVVLAAVVVHEFTYAVGRYRKEMSRQDIANYLIAFMALPSVLLEDDAVLKATRYWASTPNLGFVDAYLAVRAQQQDIPVFTKNIRHFDRFDVSVPNPLAK